jgi:hypothetical protein
MIVIVAFRKETFEIILVVKGDLLVVFVVVDLFIRIEIDAFLVARLRRGSNRFQTRHLVEEFDAIVDSHRLKNASIVLVERSEMNTWMIDDEE